MSLAKVFVSDGGSGDVVRLVGPFVNWVIDHHLHWAIR